MVLRLSLLSTFLSPWKKAQENHKNFCEVLKVSEDRPKRRDLLNKPLKHVKVSKNLSIGDLLNNFHNSSFQSRNLAYCLDVYEKMLSDNDRTTIFLGLAGAMIPGGMKQVIIKMIEEKLVDVIVSTGANLYHDFFEGLGGRHYIGYPKVDDKLLLSYDIDRIYDTFADDHRFFDTDFCIHKLAEELEPRTYSTREFLEFLGSKISDGESSFLKTAVDYGVPVFCPALNDSSIGISLTKYYVECKKKGKKPMVIDPIRDVYELTQIKQKSKKTGYIVIGGGTPKNYIQQLALVAEILQGKYLSHNYALQIITDSPHWGGLSGCTLSEAQSWGKIAKDASTATVHMDATIGLPLLVCAVLQRFEKIIKQRKRLKFTWNSDELKELTTI
ncbi:MAG: deoxyhypusine synthase family protein [Candidatus Hodarchaeota archaeon]